MKKEILQIMINGLVKAKQKWQNIVVGHGVDLQERNCELCKIYTDYCEGCPIHLETNQFCKNTPYIKWIDHHEKVHKNFDSEVFNNALQPLCKDCKLIAQEEVDLVDSLLIKYQKQLKEYML